MLAGWSWPFWASFGRVPEAARTRRLCVWCTGHVSLCHKENEAPLVEDSASVLIRPRRHPARCICRPTPGRCRGRGCQLPSSGRVGAGPGRDSRCILLYWPSCMGCDIFVIEVLQIILCGPGLKIIGEALWWATGSCCIFNGRPRSATNVLLSTDTHLPIKIYNYS
jgi:hypothetical protein